MSDTNSNLMQIAGDLMDASLVAKYDHNDTETSNNILSDAATVYEEAGSPHDAEVCRQLIEEN